MHLSLGYGPLEGGRGDPLFSSPSVPCLFPCQCRVWAATTTYASGRRSTESGRGPGGQEGGTAIVSWDAPVCSGCLAALGLHSFFIIIPWVVLGRSMGPGLAAVAGTCRPLAGHLGAVWTKDTVDSANRRMGKEPTKEHPCHGGCPPRQYIWA